MVFPHMTRLLPFPLALWPAFARAFPDVPTRAFRTRRRRRPEFLLALLLFPLAAHAQGGPPFRTDDPDTPGNKHWEINFGWIGDRNPQAGAYQVPDIDINYGLGDRVQLKYELPIAIEEIRPLPGQPGSVIAGLGESLLGIKWRFYEHHPDDPWIK